MTIHETAEAITLAVSPHVPEPGEDATKALCMTCSVTGGKAGVRWPCVTYDDDLDYVTKALTEFAERPEKLKAKLTAAWGNLSPNTTFGMVLKIVKEAL